MSQLSGKLTSAGHALIASRIALNENLVLSEFVFANVPGLNPNTAPNDYSESIPAANIVHRAPVTRTGYIDNDTVIYSIVLNSTVGDFDFNWVGLLDNNGELVILKYVNLQEKRGNEFGEGNNINRNFALKFTGAANVTSITVPAESWQYDMTTALIDLQQNIDQEAEIRANADSSLQANIDALNASLFYSAGRNYAIDDAVFGLNGRRYICIQANGPATTVRGIGDQNYWLVEYKHTFHKANPIGRILYSHDNTNPGNIYGTWAQIAQGRTIVGVNPSDSDFNTAGKTGGTKTHSHSKGTLKADGHVLTEAQMPNHNHTSTIRKGERSQGAIAAGETLRADSSVNNGTTNINTDSAGGGQAHDHSVSGNTATSSNLMPYIAKYIWQRVA